MPSLEDAILLATLAHHGKKDKNGQPCILHSLKVMFRLKTPLERMTGVLHDAINDSSLSLGDLRKWGYPPEMVEALKLLTPRPRQNFKEYIAAIKTDPLAKRVKLAELMEHLEAAKGTAIGPDERALLIKYKKAGLFLKGR